MIFLVLSSLVLLLLLSFGKRNYLKLPPGPVGLPVLGYLPFMGTIPILKIQTLAAKYGNIFSVTFGQYLVVFVNDLETMQEMGKIDNFLGRNQLEIIKPIREKTGLVFLEERGWQEWRRFVFKSLKDMGFGRIGMEGLILDQVQDSLDLLRKSQGTPLYLKNVIEVASVNALWQILAGEKYDIEDPEKRQILELINEGISEQNIMGIICFLPTLAKMFPSLSGWGNAMKLLGSPMKLGEDILRRHQENHCPGQERDLIDLALTKIYSTTDTNSPFYGQTGLNNLLHTVLDLFFTGSDSISSTLGWAMLFIAAFPDVQRKVQAEIDRVVGKHNRPSLMDRPKMLYTEATMLEVLRKSTIAPFGIMHTALQDQEFKGFFFPKRTVILWNIWGVHHDPKVWGDPHNFRPERFISAEGEIRRGNLVPFFTGKRSCPGESLAINEFFLFFTGVLQKFNVELEKSKEMPDFGPRMGFVIRPPDHKVVLVERSLQEYPQH